MMTSLAKIEIINGEKFQQIADISVITPRIKSSQYNLSKKNLYIFPEFEIELYSYVYQKIYKFIRIRLFHFFPKIIKRTLLILNLNLKIKKKLYKKKKKKIILNHLIRIPKSMKKAKIIFVYTDLLDIFFKHIYPNLLNRFIMITHNSDFSITKKYEMYLNENKIFKWYGQNCGIHHPKLIPIPIGIANSQWPHGDEESMLKVMKNIESSRINKAYANFKIKTNRKHRQKVYELLNNHKFIISESRKQYYDYLKDLTKYNYSIVPRGNGQDCHRLWESLYLDTIPIIDDKKLYENFTTGIWKGTPILLIEKWDYFSQEIIERKKNNIFFNNKWKEKLNFNYWESKINQDAKEISKI